MFCVLSKTSSLSFAKMFNANLFFIHHRDETFKLAPHADRVAVSFDKSDVRLDDRTFVFYPKARAVLKEINF